MNDADYSCYAEMLSERGHDILVFGWLKEGKRIERTSV